MKSNGATVLHSHQQPNCCWHILECEYCLKFKSTMYYPSANEAFISPPGRKVVYPVRSRYQKKHENLTRDFFGMNGIHSLSLLYPRYLCYRCYTGTCLSSFSRNLVNWFVRLVSQHPQRISAPLMVSRSGWSPLIFYSEMSKFWFRNF